MQVIAVANRLRANMVQRDRDWRSSGRRGPTPRGRGGERRGSVPVGIRALPFGGAQGCTVHISEQYLLAIRSKVTSASNNESPLRPSLEPGNTEMRRHFKWSSASRVFCGPI